MSIQQRLDDADHLLTHGRHTGAILSVCIAVAATSRKRYPRGKHSDRESFVRFCDDEVIVITHGAVSKSLFVRVPGADKTRFPDEMLSLGEMLYTFVRCELAHEGGLPKNVEFIEAPPGILKIDINDDRLAISGTIFDGLKNAVMIAPENAAEFPQIAAMSNDAIGKILFGGHASHSPYSEYLANRVVCR